MIDFVVQNFAVFNKEFDDNRRYFEDINSLTKKYFTTNDKVEAFVIKNTPNIVTAYNKAKKTNNIKETERWLKVIEVLRVYPKFDSCYFFKASIIRNGLAKILKSGVIREGSRMNINVDYNNFCDISDSEINIEYDECLLIPSGDKKTKIECRYDSALFAFQAKSVLSKTPTQIILNCRSSQDIETKIKIPLQIKRNYFFLVVHVILSLAGAVLIGLPGILPDTTPTETTVSMFIAGSLFIAFNWLIPYKE